MRKAAALFLFSAALVTAKDLSDIRKFYIRFSAAFTRADHQGLIDKKLVYFPLKLKGTLDDSPEITVTAKEFPKLLPKLVAQPSGMNARNFNETEGEYIAAHAKSGKIPEEAGEGSVRAGNLVFARKNQGWGLVQVYVSDELIAETAKTAKTP